MATPFFIFKAKKNGLAVNRFGVVVGSSVDKRAVRRNAMERQVKRFLVSLPGGGDDIIVMVTPAAGKLAKEDFIQKLDAEFAKLNLPY